MKTIRRQSLLAAAMIDAIVTTVALAQTAVQEKGELRKIRLARKAAE